MTNNSIKNSRLGRHLSDFPYIWIFFLILIVASIFAFIGLWNAARWIGIAAVTVLALLLLASPMNAVYGLMGTSGSIRLFFIIFLLISLIFAGVYHLSFFRDAGITYDVNQPHIDYQVFAKESNESPIRVITHRDSLILEHHLDSISFKESVIHITKDTLNYQRISFMQVWRSTLITTLTQEPADLFTIATVHNAAMSSSDVTLDTQKSNLFEWILLLHIIISWIFFGVFISMIYNKFRYES